MKRAPSRRRVALLLLALLLSSSLVAAAVATLGDSMTPRRYATTYGHGLDKWATAWLLTRHVEPDARLTVVERGGRLPQDATAFDVPGARYVRTGERSAFSAALDAHGDATRLQQRLARAVHQIEVAYWQGDSTPAALSMEQGFRRLQRGQDRVSADCYLRFLDSVAAAMRKTEPGDALPAERLLSDCKDGGPADRAPGQPSVREITIETALEKLGQGEDVVFVDVREAEEFAETRIPTAINIPIRSLDESLVGQLDDADLVVSYCVKDFRGYEMAKLLARAGVDNSAILNPFGLKGWIDYGLPVSGDEALSEERGTEMLHECATTGSCAGAQI